MANRRLPFKLLALIGVLSIPIAASDIQAAEEFRETYEAFAVSMGTSHPPIIPAGQTATIQINITRWTTPEERTALLTQLMENGQKGLVKSLQDQKETGWVINRSQTPTSARTRALRGTSAPSYRLRYAWQIDRGAGNRRIVAALDRPIGFAEASSNPRWRDYDVTLIVLDVNEKGEGQGQLALGVRLEFEPESKRLVVENFGSEPVRLNNVRKR